MRTDLQTHPTTEGQTMTTTYVTPTDVGVHVGDFFYASWGYDQTNVTWFKVVGLTPKGVKVQEVYGSTVSDDGPSTTVVPTDRVKTGGWVRNSDGDSVYDPDAKYPVLTKRVQQGYQGTPVLAWKSYGILYLWDGKPQYQTGSGWGH